MNYKRFDRHELFDTFLMKYHSTTIRLVEDYLLETGQPLYNDLTNMLNGIWDGYLYDELLIKALILPTEDYRRVEDMVNIINEHIESKTLTKL
jgi:hypothetical protein